MFGSCNGSEPSGPSKLRVAAFGTAANSPDAATVRFGLVDVGSGFPPPSMHDQSAHASRTMVPGTVVIDRGGTVTFDIVNPLQFSIYGPG
jgi:hypothetical protein